MRLLRIRLARFVLVGLLNTAVAYALYAALVYAGLPFAVANLLALVAGVLFSFRTQGSLVFGNRDPGRLGRFIACWIAIYMVNVTLIAAFVRAGLDAYSAAALALPLIALISYWSQKRFVFGVPASSGPRSADSQPAKPT
jgi:putative flippase GtrA